jgi:hypothetical protein
LNYDGSNDYVDLGNSVGNQTVRTIEMWFKPTATIDSTSIIAYGDFRTLIARNDATQNKEFGMYFSNLTNHKGQLVFFVRTTGGGLTEIYSNSHSWTGGTWYHVAGVIDGTNGMILYINGSSQVSAAPGQTSAVQTGASEITTLGCWGDANIRFFNGRMENVRIWSSARSASDVSNYQCAEPTTTSLIAYYKFNEGGGISIVNAVSTSFTGTPHNGPTWVGDAPCSGWYPRLANPDSEQGSVVSGLDFNMYPNPANDVLNIRTNQPGKVHVHIYDMTGKLMIESFSEQESAVDVGKLSRGIYLVMVSDENGSVKTGKFIKQ